MHQDFVVFSVFPTCRGRTVTNTPLKMQASANLQKSVLCLTEYSNEMDNKKINLLRLVTTQTGVQKRSAEKHLRSNWKARGAKQSAVKTKISAILGWLAHGKKLMEGKRPRLLYHPHFVWSLDYWRILWESLDLATSHEAKTLLLQPIVTIFLIKELPCIK